MSSLPAISEVVHTSCWVEDLESFMYLDEPKSTDCCCAPSISLWCRQGANVVVIIIYLLSGTHNKIILANNMYTATAHSKKLSLTS